MEIQLLNELKNQSPPPECSSPDLPVAGAVKAKEAEEAVEPAAQLVSELFESLKSKSLPKEKSSFKQVKEEDKSGKVDFKANLRKVKDQKDEHQHQHQLDEQQQKSHIVDFKSTLRKTKVDKDKENNGVSPKEDDLFKVKLKSTAKDKDDESTAAATDEPVDFKARLRKVSGNKPVVTVSATSVAKALKSTNNNSSSNNNDKRGSVSSVENEPAAVSTEKRKSTGSITSLRKMWETTSPTQEHQQQQGSPTSPTSPENGPKTTVKFVKRVWPPVPNTENTEKPMVPVKPTVQTGGAESSKPAPTTKPPPPKEPSVKPPPKPLKPFSNIYAAPSSTSKPKVSSKKPAVKNGGKSKSSSVETDNNSSPSPSDSDKEAIIGQSETLLESLKKKPSSMMQLSDKVGQFHGSCCGYIDQVPVTGRFRFRSLLNKLEDQSRDIRRSKSAANVDLEQVQVTVKDIAAAIQR